MQNSGLLQDYLFFSRLTRTLLFLVGLYPILKSNKFYRALSIFHLVMLSTTTLFMFNYVRLYCTSIKTLTRGLSFGTSYLTIILKVIIKSYSQFFTLKNCKYLNFYFIRFCVSNLITKIIWNCIKHLNKISTMFY